MPHPGAPTPRFLAAHPVTQSEPNVAKRPISWLRGPLKIKGLTTGKPGQSDFETLNSEESEVSPAEPLPEAFCVHSTIIAASPKIHQITFDATERNFFVLVEKIEARQRQWIFLPGHLDLRT
jgi:hypothetical protein